MFDMSKTRFGRITKAVLLVCGCLLASILTVALLNKRYPATTLPVANNELWNVKLVRERVGIEVSSVFHICAKRPGAFLVGSHMMPDLVYIVGAGDCIAINSASHPIRAIFGNKLYEL